MSVPGDTLKEYSPSQAEGGKVDITQTIVNALVVGVVGAILGWMVHGLRTEVRAEIGTLREEFRDLRREVAEMRSDLTHVALAVGAKRPARDR